MRMGERPIIFLDGGSLAYRAFYALPKLQTSQGRPTGATLGFLNMLLRLIDTYYPLMTVAAFDHPQKTFRHEMYKEYKAKRKPMPEEMKPQLEDIKKLLLAMGFLVLEVAGFEGDDLIGSGVAQLKYRYPLIIVTMDLDLLQLVDQKVILLQPIKGVAQLKKIDLGVLHTEWGISPSQVVD
ncbi:MAG: 5'-3' exonuclease, partial [Candidatus Caldatribacteriaceae bacterium]